MKEETKASVKAEPELAKKGGMGKLFIIVIVIVAAIYVYLTYFRK